MRKIAAIFLAACLMLFVFAGCGGDGKMTTPITTSKATTTTTTSRATTTTTTSAETSPSSPSESSPGESS